jgi:hypothetical protein
MMAWLGQHAGNLMAGGGSIGAIILIAFKDSLREWWQEYHAAKRMARDAHLAASGKDGKLASAFIDLLKSDLESQGRTREQMSTAIASLAKSMEQVLDTQRILSNQINDMNKDLTLVKGAVLGRYQ